MHKTMTSQIYVDYNRVAINHLFKTFLARCDSSHTILSKGKLRQTDCLESEAKQLELSTRYDYLRTKQGW